MVKSVDNVTLDTIVEVSEVADHSGDLVHLAAYGNLDYIVMPVAMRVAALAVDREVFLLGVGLRVQTVGGTQNVSSR
jgi:hypothetical protein